jgi:hypothetical protein
VPGLSFHGTRQKHSWTIACRGHGRKAGSEPGYSYSPATKQADIVWDVRNLEAYLADPARTVPGNKMPFPGLKTENDRKDIYTLVDHALARAERGLLGVLSAEGPPNPEIYNGKVMPGMGHSGNGALVRAGRF